MGTSAAVKAPFGGFGSAANSATCSTLECLSNQSLEKGHLHTRLAAACGGNNALIMPKTVKSRAFCGFLKFVDPRSSRNRVQFQMFQFAWCEGFQ